MYAVSEELFNIIPHKNKYILSEKEIINYIKELQKKRKHDLCFIFHLKEDKKHLQEELDFIKEDANNILYKLTINEERINKALHLMNHVEEYDYRLFIERLENILKGDE